MDLTDLLRVRFAPGADPSGDPALWQWEDRTVDVRADGVEITGGRADESGQVDAGRVTLVLDNTGGHYCTRNPLGRWYGTLARNTPIRVGTISGAHAFTTNASNGFGTPDVGTSWSVDGTASTWSVSSGMARKAFAAANSSGAAILNGADARNGEATFVASSPVVATGNPLIVGFFCRRSSAGNLLFTIEFGLSGQVVAKIRRAVGVSLTELVSVSLGFTYIANERIKARCEWDGPNLRMRIWEEAGSEPTTWNITATDTEITGSEVGLFFWRTNGNSNAGTVTLAADDLEVEAVEFTGTVAEWPVRWDPSARVSWAPITAAGVLRRLAQGQPTLRSPMFRQLSSRELTGYWPLEDGSDATVAASAVPWNRPANITNVTFASDTSLPGAESAVTFQNTASTIRGRLNRQHTSDGFAAMLVFKLSALPAGGSDSTILLLGATGRIALWRLMVTNVTFRLVGYDDDENTVFDTITGIYTINPLNWVAVQLETNPSGANQEWAVLWHQVGSNDFYGNTGLYASTVAPQIRSWQVGGSLALTDYQVGQVWIGSNTLPFVSADFADASRGYSGETAATRVARLADEESVQVAVEAGSSERLGPQRVATFLDNLRAAEAADSGILYESGAGLGYRPRGARYNRPVSFALDVDDGDLGDPPPEPTDDDQRVRNDWTITRDGGSSAQVVDDAHIAGNGRYADSATLTIESDLRTEDHAGWRVHVGTVEEMRWPQITLNFTDRPDLLTKWRGRPYSPRVTIANVPAEGGPDPDLIVEGWTQRITSHSWTVDLTCSPASPWDVGVYDDTAKRRDSLSTTLGVARNTVQTSWTFTTSNPADLWDTTATPYQVMCGGELLTVTSMGAASGSGPYTQPATVTRSVNGVVKSQAANTSIRIANPAIRAL